MNLRTWGARLMMLMLLFTFGCMSDYQKALKKAEQEVKELEEKFDIVIPEEERVPEKGKIAALNSTYGSKAPVVLGGTSTEVKAAVDKAVASGQARKVHVYVLDTAPDVRHPGVRDIAGTSEIFVPNDTGSDGDTQGHGTHCLGIVGGIYPANPSLPVGVASYLREHDLLTLHAGQVLNDQGSGAFSWIKKGLLWVLSDSKEERQKGEFIIVSLSLGATTNSTYLDATLQTLRNVGILVVAANGNTYKTPVNYPGKSAYTWGVASLQLSGNELSRSPFSSYGPETYTSALGSSVWSSYKNNQWTTLSGTSMATPGIAGVAAVLAAIYPDMTISSLEALVEKYSRDLGKKGRDPYYGYGLPFLVDLIEADVPGDAPKDDPDEPGDNPDPDPTPDPEPGPSPDRPDLNKPATVQYLSPKQSVGIRWTKRGQGIVDTSFTLSFQVKATLKSKSKTPEVLLDKVISDYFDRRMIVLPGSYDLDTKHKSLYYAVHFLEMDLIRRKNMDVNIDFIGELPTGVFLQGKDLPNIRTTAAYMNQIPDGVVTYEVQEE